MNPSARNTLLMLLYIATEVAAEASNLYIQCEADHQCSKRQYCYTASGMCANCTECRDYHREQPPGYPICPKNPHQCGQCLDGYKEDIFTEGEKRHSCIPLKSGPAQSSPPDNNTADNSVLAWIFATILIAVMVILIAVFAWKIWRKGRKQRSRGTASQQNSQDPPPYNASYNSPELTLQTTSDTPLSTDQIDNLINASAASEQDVNVLPSEEQSVFLNFKEGQASFSVQQAVPFIDAHWPYERSNEEEEEPIIDEGGTILEGPWNSQGFSEEEEPFIGDDNTLESPWTPHINKPTDIDSNSTYDSNECGQNRKPLSSGAASELSSQPASSAVDSLVTHEDSGVSDSSCRTSSASLPLRPFKMIGRSESEACLPLELSLPVSHARSLSEEDVCGNTFKRARHDSGNQSISEETGRSGEIVFHFNTDTEM